MQSILHTTLMRHTAFILIAVMTMFSFVPKAEAGLVPTAMTMASELRSQDLASVQKVLEHKAVKARLASLGYSDAEVSAKLSQVSDSELHSLASQLDALDAGGDGIGIIIGLLVIVLLVVVILKLSDKTVTIR